MSMLSLRPYQNDVPAIVLTPEWRVVPDVWEYRNGHLYWRVKCGRGVAVKHPGEKVVLKPDAQGYCYVTWRRKHYAVHRVVFLLTRGWLPDCIDHINGNPTDNRAENLRAATRLQNQHNRRINEKSASRIKNVMLHNNKWLVRFSIQGKTKHFGRFDDVELAELVAQEARSLLHGEFARHV